MKLRPKDIRRAEETKYLSLIPPTGTSKENLKTILDAIGERGWVLVERSPASPFSEWTTTFHGRIALRNGFWNLPVWQQQAILWHEYVHIEQRIDMGRHRFNVRWAGSPRWRWSLEVPAYRESVRNLRGRGASVSEINEYIDSSTENLRKKYLLKILDPSQMKMETKRILLLGASDWNPM